MTNPITEAEALLSPQFTGWDCDGSASICEQRENALRSLVKHAKKLEAERDRLDAGITQAERELDREASRRPRAEARIARALAFFDTHWLAPFPSGTPGHDLIRILRGES